MRVPANAAAQGELLPGGRVANVEGALLSRQLGGLRDDGALRQLRLGHVGDPLEVVVARVAEVSRPEAEEDGDGAAVPETDRRRNTLVSNFEAFMTSLTRRKELEFKNWNNDRMIICLDMGNKIKTTE